ncbi:hypothetical protein ACINK0_02050 [Deinococcus sp. VB343]|uniref:Uncharacterized protein n=1 Tax=Deinococcus sp. VB142 TaxID=3112952 RepID=A0AAU6Q1I6_9DEIO
MSSFSGGGFFGRSHSSGHRRGGMVRGYGHSHSSGHRMGGFLGGSHSSGGRGRYVQGGHLRPVHSRGPRGCLGAFLVGGALVGSGLAGLVSLLA